MNAAYFWTNGLGEISPAVLIVLAAIFGLMVGSFLNVVIYRLPKMMEIAWEAEISGQSPSSNTTNSPYNLWVPRSACVHCQKPIKALQNIPVISFLWLKGRCKGCQQPISWQYPFVEILMGFLSVLLITHYGLNGQYGQYLAAMALVSVLIALAMIDLKTQLLPDVLTLSLLWLGLLCNIDSGIVPIQDAVIGAVVAYLSLWSVYWIFLWLRGKEGLGYGDFKLFAALGAWFGWMALPQILLIATCSALLVQSLLLALTKRSYSEAFSFGPYLALAGIGTLLWGNQLLYLF